MFFFVSFAAFISFPNRKDAILSTTDPKNVSVEVSGSFGIVKNGNCVKTTGNETISSDEWSDWCSNIVNKENSAQLTPFIQYSIKEKQIKVKSYSVRNGCCRYSKFCDPVTGEERKDSLCCNLFSYSLHGSNDNKTWIKLHSVSEDFSFRWCETKTFTIEGAALPYRYIRFVMDKPFPGCSNCLLINQLELYGQIVKEIEQEYDEDNDDETISIIGKFKEK